MELLASKLEEKGQKADYKKILAEIIQRDQQDMTRKVAPLKQTKSHILVDTSDMEIDQVVERIKDLIQEKVGK